MLPLLTRIDHVGIACRDLEAAIGLYPATFGLEVVSLELHEEQGVREAMLAGRAGRARWPAGLRAAARAAGTRHPGGQVPRPPWRGPAPRRVRRQRRQQALAAIGGTGIRLIDERPRHGSMGASIAFLHPADLGGVLTELVQSAGPA